MKGSQQISSLAEKPRQKEGKTQKPTRRLNEIPTRHRGNRIAAAAAQ